MRTITWACKALFWTIGAFVGTFLVLVFVLYVMAILGGATLAGTGPA